MKQHLFLSLALFSAATLFAAEAPKDEVTAAIKKLESQPNYSWRVTVVVPESNQFKPGPTEGKADKEFLYLEMTFGDNTTELVKKGEKAVITDENGEWRLTSDFENEEGFARFRATLGKNAKTAAAQALELVGFTKELKKEGDVFSGPLTDEGAKKQFRFGEPKDAKAVAKVWVKDGMLSKIEVKVDGKLEFNGNEIDAARTTTTEIKNVGTTKLTIPATAKSKIS